MNRILAVFLAAVVASVGLVGCDSDTYSKLVHYGVRTDPLVKPKVELGKERIDPDRPGTLPLLSPKDLLDPFNPFYPNRDTLFKEDKLRDPMRIVKYKDQDGKYRYPRSEMNAILVGMFGTPASPFVSADPSVIETLKLQGEALARGSAAYRVHCVHCHGVTGDGRGPTGRWVNPHPRDYRQGLFKFTSVNQATASDPRPARREDLVRVLEQGVQGTAMPSFVLLRPQELEDLVSYVIHLSIRGKVEFDTIMRFDFDPKENTLTPSSDEPIETTMGDKLKKALDLWMEAQMPENFIPVVAYPYKSQDPKDPDFKNSVLRGYKLFLGEGVEGKEPGPAEVSKKDAEAAKCVSCHMDFGRQSPFKFDDWGTLVKARDLTQGNYRGGRRPVDFYYRIHSGITGSGMNVFGKVLGKQEQIWDLVNFVQVLPYPQMRKALGIQTD